MKALCWTGPNSVEVQDVPDPTILNARDAIVQGHLDRDLRLGPAPARRLRAHDAEGRRDGP